MAKTKLASRQCRHEAQDPWTQEVFRVLWRNFVIVAEQCVALGGGVAFEWPRSCAYWRDRGVQSFIKRQDMTEVQFDGCMYGLTSLEAKDVGHADPQTMDDCHLDEGVESAMQEV